MRCRRCHKALKDPASIERQFGPVCWAKANAEVGQAQDQTQKELPLLPFDGDIVLRRTPSGIETNVPHTWRYHSSSFEWGYGGSGPSDLALNILLLFGIDRRTAFGLHQEFKWKFIATMPHEGGIIKGEDIRQWLESKLAAA